MQNDQILAVGLLTNYVQGITFYALLSEVKCRLYSLLDILECLLVGQRLNWFLHVVTKTTQLTDDYLLVYSINQCFYICWIKVFVLVIFGKHLKQIFAGYGKYKRFVKWFLWSGNCELFIQLLVIIYQTSTWIDYYMLATWLHQ